MKELKELCEKVLEDVKKGDPRPLKMLENGSVVLNEAAFTAANSAERLAKACLVLSECVEKYAAFDQEGSSLIPLGREATIALSKANKICRGEE